MSRKPRRTLSKNLDNSYYRAAIYCRLSKEDELLGESASVENQKGMLADYCKSNGWEVIATFADDGYTGLNQDRPDFQRLLKACEDGLVNMVVVKDLSRLGRNHVETSHLVEDYFPRKGIRFVAMNDSVDTLYGDNEIAPFKNILNEMYSKDISKKVHSTYKHKAKLGKFTGCLAPFGYMKDPEDKNHLIIDPETAPIVKQIFEYAANGRGPQYIRTQLERQKVPAPTWWNRQKGLRDTFTKWELKDPENGRYMWDCGVIQDILKNPVYIGVIASQKFDYKFKLGVIGAKPEDEWIWVDDMHDPLVTREMFDLVQYKVKSRKRTIEGQPSLFQGLVKCAECGASLTLRMTSHVKHPQPIYCCHTYNKFGSKHCSQHRIDEAELNEIVLTELRSLAKLALEDEDLVIERLTNACEADKEEEIEELTRQIAKDEERLAALDKIVMKLYEDMIAERINSTNFDIMMNKTQREQEELKMRVKEAKQTLGEAPDQIYDKKTWLDLIRSYADVTELDRDMLNRLIKVIYVHEEVDPNITRSRERNRTVEIHFNLRPVSKVEKELPKVYTWGRSQEPESADLTKIS